eukprot:CAMPEP_0197076830 /NCGR_PEP_ID=MMETSP1384-20130603/212313_1 /TAXON_ID=29189 /ORGANISM="Ammonia sp." /LENGTH=354 /DNA_ID=CAMNT_0042515689 /DNA_START=43 /DNA_END=1108 /DNA_ORIENTATION=+
MTHVSNTKSSHMILLSLIVYVVNYARCQEHECEEPESCAYRDFGDNDFESLECSGLASCYGASGAFACDEGDGCEVQCTAAEACAYSYIQAAGIKQAECDAFKACMSATMDFYGTEEFVLECKGYQACAGESAVDSGFALLPVKQEDDYYIEGLSCEGVQSCHLSYFYIEAARKVTCDGEAVCAESIEGLSCEGVQSCHLSYFYIEAARKVTCDGEAVCAESMFQIISPAEGFEFECQGDAACSGVKAGIYIERDDTDTKIKSITCDGNEACLESRLQIYNDNEETLVIDELRCEGWEACKYLLIQVMTGDVKIKKCICDDPSPYSCLCATGLSICEELEGEWNTAGTDTFTCG